MPKIRIFTLNENGKIELTQEELQTLLDESYNDGRNAVIITTPSYPADPYNPFRYSEITCNSNAEANN